MTRLLLLMILSALARSAAAEPWIPSGCSRDWSADWNRFRQAVRTAVPGSTLYAPKPFPQSAGEILEDFKYAYCQMGRGIPASEIPADEKPLYEAVQSGSFTYRIARVENWSPTRCLREYPKGHYLLVYIQDRARGSELGRFALNESGLASGWAVPPTDTRERQSFQAGLAPRLGEAMEKARLDFGVNATKAQYITAYGTLSCAIIAPCVAMQAEGKTYLFRGGELFAFGPSSCSHSLAEMNDREQRAAIEMRLNPKEEHLVSVGGERWVVVRKVAHLR
jgi:hypothetical protein